MNVDEAINLFVEASGQVQSGALADAQESFSRVLAFQQTLAAPHELSNDVGEVSLMMTLANLAVVAQRRAQFDQMLKMTTQLIELPDSAAALWNLHATALHHTGRLGEALDACKRALALDPTSENVHHERACIQVAQGAHADALESLSQAIELGSDPESLLADDDLAPLRGDAGFQRLTGDAHQIGVLQRRIRGLAGGGGGLPEVTPEYMEQVEQTLPLTRRLLELARVGEAPRRDRGDGVGIVDGAKCEPVQRQVLETLLACTSLWHAIPFLLVLGEFGVPNLSVGDAAEKLGLEPARA